MCKRYKIFLSHAYADRALCDRFLKFLTLGCHVAYDDIYYTDKPTMQIPNNVYFPDDMLEGLKNSEIVVFVISSNFLNRPNCSIELGAALAHGKNIICLLVPPITHANMPGFAIGKQIMGDIDDEDALFNFNEEVMKLLHKSVKNVSKTKTEIKDFLKDCKGILEKLEPDRVITKEEFDRLKKRAERNEAIIKEQDDELEKLQEKYEKVKNAKDADEVRKIEWESMEDAEQYEELVEQAQNDLLFFDRSMQEFIYAQLLKERSDLDTYDYQFNREGIQNSIKKSYILIEGDSFILNREHSNVLKVLNSLDKLDIFLNEKDDSNRSTLESKKRHLFLVSLQKKYGFPIDLTNEDYWKSIFA